MSSKGSSRVAGCPAGERSINRGHGAKGGRRARTKKDAWLGKSGENKKEEEPAGLLLLVSVAGPRYQFPAAGGGSTTTPGASSAVAQRLGLPEGPLRRYGVSAICCADGLTVEL